VYVSRILGVIFLEKLKYIKRLKTNSYLYKNQIFRQIKR
jgi:hypothetical protein